MTDAAALRASDTLTYQAPAAPSPPPATPQAAEGDGGLTFHELLSDLNPLQYLPVVGTIYRAVTGDTIPKPLREAGSVVVSGLMSGPVGLGISLGVLAFQKLTGIDFEEVEQSLVAAISGPATTAVAAAPPSSAPLANAPQAMADVSPHAGAWTPAQLSAYGVVTLSDGTLRQGDLAGADVLNALQLAQGGAWSALA